MQRKLLKIRMPTVYLSFQKMKNVQMSIASIVVIIFTEITTNSKNRAKTQIQNEKKNNIYILNRKSFENIN